MKTDIANLQPKNLVARLRLVPAGALLILASGVVMLGQFQRNNFRQVDSESAKSSGSSGSIDQSASELTATVIEAKEIPIAVEYSSTNATTVDRNVDRNADRTKDKSTAAIVGPAQDAKRSSSWNPNPSWRSDFIWPSTQRDQSQLRPLVIEDIPNRFPLDNSIKSGPPTIGLMNSRDAITKRDETKLLTTQPVTTVNSAAPAEVNTPPQVLPASRAILSQPTIERDSSASPRFIRQPTMRR